MYLMYYILWFVIRLGPALLLMVTGYYSSILMIPYFIISGTNLFFSVPLYVSDIRQIKAKAEIKKLASQPNKVVTEPAILHEKP